MRPDRYWRWTTFRPSPFVLGAEKLAGDDQLVGLYAHAQSAVAEVVMRDVAPRRLDPKFATWRQSMFIQMLIASFGALEFSNSDRLAYLRHHRDWLVRFFIAQEKSPDSSPETVLAPLRARIATMGPTLDALRQRLEASVEAGEHPVFAAWQQRLKNFFAHVSSFRGDAAYDLDPYTRDHAFLPLFKLLHGACNQFGLRLKNELYVHELLLTATKVEEL